MTVRMYNAISKNIRIRSSGVFVAPELIADAGLNIENSGGYYAGGNIIVGDNEYAIIIAPKASGYFFDHPQWKTNQTNTTGTFSTYDGKHNTQLLVDAGINNYPAAKLVHDLNVGGGISGFSDWHLPSPDELEVCHRYLKPNTQETISRSRGLHAGSNGTNPNSNPLGVAYTSSYPVQTNSPDFQQGGSQTFGGGFYWSSMEYSSTIAWYQNFSNGDQLNVYLQYPYSVRAVRWERV